MSFLFLIFFLFCGYLLLLAWQKFPKETDDEADVDVCLNCGYDLRASKGRCPECGMKFDGMDRHIPLRDDWPADAISPRIPSPIETPVCVHTTDSEWEARALQSQFECRGIAAQIADRPVIAEYVATTGMYKSVGSLRVMVWSADEELAIVIRNKLIPRLSEKKLETAAPSTLDYQTESTRLEQRGPAPDGYMGHRSSDKELEIQIAQGTTKPRESFGIVVWIISFGLGIIGLIALIDWLMNKAFGRH